MRQWKNIVCIALVSVAALWSPEAKAQESLFPAPVQAPHSPLVILRFNQPRLAFKQALYEAASSALAAKQDVVFDIVLRPAGGAAQENNMNLQSVTSAFSEMGLPANRMTTQLGDSSGKGYDEVWVYVR